MILRIFLFGPARLIVGAGETDMEVPEGIVVEQAMALLFKKWPALRSMTGGLRFAVDEEYVPPGTVLREGQTMALIPPVQGG